MKTFFALLLAAITLFTPAVSRAADPADESAKILKAKNDLTQIITAIKSFYAEYGKYPVEGGKDAIFDTGTGNSVLFDILTNNTASPTNGAQVSKMNPRQIVFLEAPAAKGDHPAGGIVPKGSPNAGNWLDPWGSPYQILIDGDYDSVVANPYKDADPAAPRNLGGVIAWSLGKNGLLGGGPAKDKNFTGEGGKAGDYKDSGDVISW